MSSSQRRAGQLSYLSAWGPLLDVPVDRDGHLCGFLGAGALRGGLAGAAAELMGLSRIRFRLEGSVRGGATPHPHARDAARRHEPPACSLCCVARLSMAFGAASVAAPSDSPAEPARAEAGGAQSRREVGEDPGAPLAAVRPLGGWWHSPASATARFVPAGVLHAKRCMMHAPSAGRRPPCKQLIKTRQTCRWAAPCTRRDSWREAVQAAGVQMSRATAYRRRPRMPTGGEAAWHDRRQGHAVNVCGAVRTWLERYYQHHPHASGKAVQALLEERWGCG